MGKPELARDPRFDTNEKRHRNGVVEMVEQWLQSLGSDDEAIRLLEEAHVPVSPVLSVAEAINHPHLRERGTVVTIKDPIYGTMDVPASPVRFTQFATPDLQAPLLGERNVEILENYLGYSVERIKELEAQGVNPSGEPLSVVRPEYPLPESVVGEGTEGVSAAPRLRFVRRVVF